MTVKVIQTRYAGCHFRSRLEARWAKFFDTLGVTWEYEPQRYAVSWNENDDQPETYLPDFYLPDLDTFAEVKGDLSERDLKLIIKGVIPKGYSLPAGQDPGVILLRDIGCQPMSTIYRGLFFHEGDVQEQPYVWTEGGRLEKCGPCGWPIADDHVGFHSETITDYNELLKVKLHRSLKTGPKVWAAQQAARSARFEGRR